MKKVVYTKSRVIHAIGRMWDKQAATLSQDTRNTYGI